MATEALALDAVDALYGESHVLHGVSFALGEGRVLALLGRNGAGKTTCMNTVIGFLPPRKGTVELFGEQVARLAPDLISRKGIALVPQGRRVFARLKGEGQSILLVEQNIKLAFELADDVVILNTGRVAFTGPVAAVRDNEALITQHLGVF